MGPIGISGTSIPSALRSLPAFSQQGNLQHEHRTTRTSSQKKKFANLEETAPKTESQLSSREKTAMVQSMTKPTVDAQQSLS